MATVAAFCYLLTVAISSAAGAKYVGEGRVIFDLLASLRSNPSRLSRRGFGEFRVDGEQTGVTFTSTDRRGKLESSVARQVSQSLMNAGESAFLFTIRQNRSNAGTILAITNDKNRRLLELQSVWKREEVRLHYATEGAASVIHVEKLSYQLADSRWHQLAVAVAGDRLRLLVDCRVIYDRQLYRPIRWESLRQRASVWIGQRGRWKSYFQGEMAQALVVVGQHAVTEQCPHLEIDCPTCQQHKQLSAAVKQLQFEMKQAQQQLSQARQKLQLLSLCDCNIRCLHNGTVREDGEVWSEGDCQQCKCNKGTATCSAVQCPPVTCSAPVQLPGACCSSCLRACNLHGTVGGDLLEHGLSAVKLAGWRWDKRLCVDCHCEDGTLHCNQPADSESKCPKLDCPVDHQETNEFDCCPYCKDFDHCGRGHNCSSRANCVNRHNRFDCRCQPGYHGNGWLCLDVDECQDGSNNCGSFSDCVNTDGGFQCKCRDGFSRINNTHCNDTDECSLGTHSCSPHATCTNSPGSHQCKCLPGYHGDGVTCLPVCEPACLNGGQCISPGVCSCRTGYHGNNCQHDIDECLLGIHRCSVHSHCVNLPGSYHCVCDRGFTDSGESNLWGSLCKDVNECARTGDHTCPRDTKCVNTLGGYRCLCNGDSCSNDCRYRVSPSRHITVRHGQVKRDLLDLCSECRCMFGVLKCSRIACNCSSETDTRCCQHCHGNASCWDASESRSRRSGSLWLSGCRTCKCVNGESLCRDVTCPPAACANPVIRRGSCCPDCPHADPCHSAAWRIWRPPLAACRVGSDTRQHGDAWQLASAKCVQCQCIDGHICCSHDYHCHAVTDTGNGISTMATDSDDVTMTTDSDDVTMTTDSDDVTMTTDSDDVTMTTDSDDVTMATDSDDVTMATSQTQSLPPISRQTPNLASLTTASAAKTTTQTRIATNKASVATKSQTQSRALATASESVATAGASVATVGASLATVGATIATTAAALTTIDDGSSSHPEAAAASDDLQQQQQQQQQP